MCFSMHYVLNTMSVLNCHASTTSDWSFMNEMRAHLRRNFQWLYPSTTLRQAVYLSVLFMHRRIDSRANKFVKIIFCRLMAKVLITSGQKIGAKFGQKISDLEKADFSPIIKLNNLAIWRFSSCVLHLKQGRRSRHLKVHASTGTGWRTAWLFMIGWGRQALVGYASHLFVLVLTASKLHAKPALIAFN